MEGELNSMQNSIEKKTTLHEGYCLFSRKIVREIAQGRPGRGKLVQTPDVREPE
jgi:hypothetical protein